MTRQGRKLVWMDGWMDGKEKGERRKIGGTPGCRLFIYFALLSHLLGSLAVDGQRGKESLYSGILLFGERKVDSVSGDGNENFI
jgi:hypothetical protein